MQKWILITAPLAFLAAALFLFRAEIIAVLQPAPEVIKAQVKLRNTCDVPDSSFVVQDMATGRTAQFSNGVARVKTQTNHNLVLKLAARFDAVAFNGSPRRAKARMTLTADCTNSEKEAETLRSLRKSLGSE